MTLVADEGVDAQVVAALRRSGHEVTFVAELSPGLSDDRVLEMARESDALLMTTDKDFGELVVRQRHRVTGLILLRLAGMSPEDKAALVDAVVRERARELPGSIAVLTPRAVRLRRIS